MVESALSLLAFLFITFGTMEFAMAVQANNFCSWAARDAARWAAVRGSSAPVPATSTSITSYVKGLAVGMDPNRFSVSTAFSPDNSAGSTVRVNVQYTVVPLTWLLMKQNLTVGSTAEVPIVR
jgi:hypothetical protein